MLVTTLTTVHLGFLAFWGGIVATESILELYPFRRRELHAQTITFHYWIDLLVELPALVGVVGSGLILTVLAWPLSGLHWIKFACAAGAITANILCIAMVLRRKRLLADGSSEEDLWRWTRRVVLSAKIGLPLGVAAAALGFWLVHQRMLGS